MCLCFLVKSVGFLKFINSSFVFSAPFVSNIEAVTTKPGQYNLTENTITVDINTEYLKNDENGKQVFFGVALCAEARCIGKLYIKEIIM